MNFEVRRNGNSIVFLSYTRTQNICEGIGKVKLEVDSSLNFSIGDRIAVYEDGIKKGDYFVREISNIADNGIKTIDGQDDSWKLENFFITDNITIETAQTNLYWIEWILNQADISYSIDVNPAEAQYVEIGTSIGMEMAKDLLLNLCRYSGWYFWFDPDNVCHISKIKTDLGNVAETLTDSDIIEFESRKNDKMLRNRGLVYGGANVSTGGYIVGEQVRYTGYEYDTRDLRTVVYSNSNMSYQASATSLARQLVDEFARITHEKVVTLHGFHDLYINDTVFLNSEYFSGACLVTTVEVSVTNSGALTILTLDQRCPKLVAYFEHDYVYIGTDGQGVWRKSISTPSASWENYSTGLSDLSIKDLKISNGVFVCIGGNSVYVRNINTNWIRINLPSQYSTYIPMGVSIEDSSGLIYATYTGYSDSILVKLNFSTILEILPIVDFENKNIISNDVDIYNEKPVITGYTGFGIRPEDGFNYVYPMSGYASFGDTLVVHWLYSVSGTIYLDLKTYSMSTNTYVHGITPFVVGSGTTPFRSEVNSCSYIDGNFYFVGVLDVTNRRIIVVKYTISSNTAEIYDVVSISPSVSFSIITAYKNIIVGLRWYFNLKTRIVTYLDGLITTDYYLYKHYIFLPYTKIVQECGTPPPGHPPCSYFTPKRYHVFICYTIIDTRNGSYIFREIEHYPPSEWNSGYPSFGISGAPFLVENLFGIDGRFIAKVFYNTGITQYYEKLTVYLDSGNYTISPINLQYLGNSIHTKTQFVSFTYRDNVATRSPQGNVDYAIYYFRITQNYGFFRTFAYNVDTGNVIFFNYLDSNANIVLIDGFIFNYYTTREFITLEREYTGRLILNGYNPSEFERYESNRLRPIPKTFRWDSSVAVSSFYFNHRIFDEMFFQAHSAASPFGGVLFYPRSYTPFVGFSTYIRDGNRFRLIDTTPDITVLENNLGSNIITYPVTSGSYPISLRVSFIDSFGEFYSPSVESAQSLTSSGIFNGFSDLRTYYANPNYVGFSSVTTSGDNFLLSAVVSGLIKTSHIDLMDEFVTLSGFTNVTKIETANYNDYYFMSLSGNLFYQKIYPQIGFSLAINNIPASNITIIRLDDRL